jgi:surface polysaccharide O-acyltransferase-like enzyme
MTAISPYLSRKIAIMSFVSIVLVVLIHAKTDGSMNPNLGAFYYCNALVQNFIGEGIARTAVPLFFAFSGFLFFATLEPTVQAFRRKLAARAKSLVIPYLLWNALGILLLFLLEQAYGNTPFMGEKIIRNYTILDWLARLFLHPVQFQFWFLLDLAVYFLASPLLYILLKRGGALVPALLAVLYFSKCCKIPLYVSNASLHPEGMLFFALGAWRAVRGAARPKFGKGSVAAASIVWLCLCAVKAWLLIKYGETYPYNLLHRVTVILGVGCVWLLYDLLPARATGARLWSALAASTFFLYAFHEPAQSIIRIELLKKVSQGPGMLALCYFICPVLTIALALALSALVRRHAPRAFALLTGGRAIRTLTPTPQAAEAEKKTGSAALCRTRS